MNPKQKKLIKKKHLNIDHETFTSSPISKTEVFTNPLDIFLAF